MRIQAGGGEVLAQLTEKEQNSNDELFFLFSSTYFTEGTQWFFQRKLQDSRWGKHDPGRGLTFSGGGGGGAIAYSYIYKPIAPVIFDAPLLIHACITARVQMILASKANGK